MLTIQPKDLLEMDVSSEFYDTHVGALYFCRLLKNHVNSVPSGKSVLYNNADTDKFSGI